MNNVKITATSGKIAGFDISGNNLVGTGVSLKPNEITLGDSILRGATGGSLDTSYLQIVTPNQSVGGIYLDNAKIIQKIGNTVRMQVDYISPNGSGGNIGADSNRYSTIYLTSQPNVSSDTRYKSDIQDIDPLLIEIIGREVKPKQYRTIYDDKLHFGYIAQDVERALYKYCGNDKDKYAMLSKDESYMSLLYGEIAVLMDAYNRDELAKQKLINEDLQSQINELKEKTWKN